MKPFPTQVVLKCKPDPVPGGSDELTAILGRYRRQIPAWEAHLSNLDGQVKQGVEALSAITTSLDELEMTAADEDVNSTIRCLEQKMAEAECQIARHHVGINAIERQIFTIDQRMATVEGEVDAANIPELYTKVWELDSKTVEWEHQVSAKADIEQLQAFEDETRAAFAELRAWHWWPLLLHLAVPEYPATRYCRLLVGCAVNTVEDLAEAKTVTLLKALNADKGTPAVHGRPFKKAEVEAMIGCGKQMREGRETGS